MVRQDAPRARMEQDEELKRALAIQQYQQELRLQQYAIFVADPLS